MVGVKVLMRNPRRELDVSGAMQVSTLLSRLDINRESVLVIRGDTIVPGDAWLNDDDDVEIRPVISGGDFGRDRPGPEHRGPTR
jgi:sulfur carrier protein